MVMTNIRIVFQCLLDFAITHTINRFIENYIKEFAAKLLSFANNMI